MYQPCNTFQFTYKSKNIPHPWPAVYMKYVIVIRKNGESLWMVEISPVTQSLFATCGLFYWHGLTWIQAWISNHMSGKVLGEITSPFINFKGCTVEV